MSFAARVSDLATRVATEFNSIRTALNGKADDVHTHVATTDLTATGTKDGTTFLRSDNTWASVAGGGPHSHDDLYYTEAEVDTVLAGKAATIHDHTRSQITDAGNAIAYNVAASGDAAANEVVLGSDTRLSAILDNGLTGSTSVKQRRDVLVFAQAASGILGSLVIDTGITYGNRMCALHIRGYNYLSSDSIINWRAHFYATTGLTINNPSFLASGDYGPSQIRFFRNPSTNTVVLVIDTATDWDYPKILVDVISTHTTTPDSELDPVNWSASITTDLTAYELKSTPAVQRNLRNTLNLSDVSSPSAALANLGVTATAAELNKLDGALPTVTEINYLDGVTSSVQTQLNGKAASSHSHAIGDLPVAPSGTSNTTQVVRADDSRLSNSRTPTYHTHFIADVADITASAAEINKLDGLLTTKTELGYVDGVTSNIQTQLNGKAATSHSHGSYVSRGGDGIVVVSAANTWYSLSISFGYTFATVPYVVACYNPTSTPPNAMISVAVSDITTTGCKVWARRDSGTANLNVSWMASVN